MSPRAACRLEQLGFPEVYDYVGGKMDWLSFDLPYEGQAVLAGGVVRRDVVTARPDERVPELRIRLEQALAGMVVVLAGDLVNGVVRRREIEGAPPDATAAKVMDVGVSTVRPSEDLAGLLERMAQADVRAITVTRSDGTLVGILDAEDVRASIHAAHHH